MRLIISLFLQMADAGRNVPKNVLWIGIYIGTLANIGLLMVVLVMWYSPYGYVASKLKTDPEFKAALLGLYEQGKDPAPIHELVESQVFRRNVEGANRFARK